MQRRLYTAVGRSARAFAARDGRRAPAANRLFAGIGRLFTLLLALTPAFAAHAEMDVEWRPEHRATAEGEIVEIDLYAVSDSAATQLMSGITVVVDWDATMLELVGHVDNGFEWTQGNPGEEGASGFPDDSGCDGINQPFEGGDPFVPDNDGLVMYRALSPVAGPNAPATPAGLLVTTLQFRALQAGATDVALLVEASVDAACAVTAVADGTFPGVDATGLIGEPIPIDICPEAMPVFMDGMCQEQEDDGGGDDGGGDGGGPGPGVGGGGGPAGGPTCATLDDDDDGVNNCDDLCDETSAGATVDEDGCSCAQLDGDDDGVDDCDDECDDTASGATVDDDGCSCAQRDADDDGIDDCDDECDDTPTSEVADEFGCSCSQYDSDGDSVDDCIDVCFETPLDETTDADGCSCSQRDTDADGIDDCDDQCAGEMDVDTDGDGAADCVDNCLDDVNASQVDSDNDGVGDVCDNCPDDANADQLDTDDDGVGDVCAEPPPERPEPGEGEGDGMVGPCGMCGEGVGFLFLPLTMMLWISRRRGVRR